MSDKGRAYVVDYSPYRGVAFTIHLLLGDLANDTHEHRLWMRAGLLAWKARTTRQTATTLLGKMVEDGFLERLSPREPNGRPVEYRFLMPEVPIQFAPVLEGGVSRADTRVSAEITPGVSRADTEPKRTQGSTKEALDQPSVDRLFTEFWKIYPRKKGKIAARKAFERALKLTKLAVLMEGVKGLVHEHHEEIERKDLRYIPHPATWLNQGRWDDERESPSANPDHNGAQVRELRPYDRAAQARVIDEVWEQVNGQREKTDA